MNGKVFDSHEKRVAILPVGSIERHGDFLPLGSDLLVPIKLAEDVEKKLPVDVYPPIAYGVSPYFKFAGGTVSIESDIYRMFVKNVVEEIIRQGYDKLIILNGHGGNTSILSLVCQEVTLSMDKDVDCLVIDWWRDIAQKMRYELFKYPGHAGEDETSIMLYLYKELVDESYKDAENKIDKRLRVVQRHYSRRFYDILYPDAYIGNPSLASIEKGEKWYNAILREILDIIRRLLND